MTSDPTPVPSTRPAAPDGTIRLLFLGDVVGRSGRDSVLAFLATERATLAPDLIVVNGENAAHGFGITPRMCEAFYEGGVDVITTGNHVWDQREIIAHIAGDQRLLRPVNFPRGTPGRGSAVLRTSSGRRILVVNVMLRLFMDPLDDPFVAMDQVLASHRLGSDVDAIFVDAHGEATSEKMALAHYLDGRVSAVVGTHTHVPTADHRIFPNGTGYLTDVGMCGDYHSVIGMRADISVQRFVRKMPGERLAAAEGPATVCGVVIDIDVATGTAMGIRPIRAGGVLSPAA